VFRNASKSFYFAEYHLLQMQNSLETDAVQGWCNVCFFDLLSSILILFGMRTHLNMLLL